MRVIEGCTTAEQLDVAQSYTNLYLNKLLRWSLAGHPCIGPAKAKLYRLESDHLCDALSEQRKIIGGIYDS